MMSVANSKALHHRCGVLPLAEYLAADTINAEWAGDELYVFVDYALEGYFFNPDEVTWEAVENG